MRRLFIEYIGNNYEQELKRELSDSQIITVSGGVCTGKSTIGKKLRKRNNLEYFSVGSIFRDMAEEREESVEEFLEYISEDPEDILEIDVLTSYKAIEKMASGGENGLIADGHLAGYYSLFLEGLGKQNSLRIYLHADEDTKSERIKKRRGISDREAKRVMEREENDRERWKKEFGITVDDESVYHLILNTGKTSANGVVNIVEDYL